MFAGGQDIANDVIDVSLLQISRLTKIHYSPAGQKHCEPRITDTGSKRAKLFLSGRNLADKKTILLIRSVGTVTGRPSCSFARQVALSISQSNWQKFGLQAHL